MDSALDTLVTALVIIAAPFGFVGFWMGVCWLLGAASGWRGLARRWRTREEAPIGAEWVSGMLGLISYNGVLSVGVAEDGLDLRVMLLFRAGQPPLRIPWSEIRVEGESPGLFGSRTRLRLGERGPTLRIPSAVWARARGFGFR
jgi:hypothetical protein